jgi:hypothetical protein
MPTMLPRTAVGLSARVTGFNQITERPLLQRELGLVICHHTGNKGTYHGKDVAKSIRAINRWKPSEYNYVIALDGTIVEFAGAHVGAHCTGRNSTSYGILFLNSVNDACTDAQVESYRWLIGCLKWTKAISPGAWQVQHGQVAATACPGRIKERWSELTA